MPFITPLDTSAADELLARVKELEEGKEHLVLQAANQAFALNDQLTTFRKALEEARVKFQEIANGEDYGKLFPIIETITRALGEEQKKEK